MSLVWESASPRRRRGTPFAVASGGHLSFNSERKVRKNATKTYGFGFPWRAMRCRKFALCPSRNRLSCVPLSVKRTVPPQLSATASLTLPRATVADSPSTAVTWSEYRRSVMPPPLEPVIPSQCSHWRGNPSSPSPRRRRVTLFYVLPPAGYFCLQRQKYPKTPLETTFQDFLGALRPVVNLFRISSRNRLSRVPLSVKRTVPPQLSATASLPLPVATVGVFPFTAVPGE